MFSLIRSISSHSFQHQLDVPEYPLRPASSEEVNNFAFSNLQQKSKQTATLPRRISPAYKNSDNQDKSKELRLYNIRIIWKGAFKRYVTEIPEILIPPPCHTFDHFIQ